MDHDIGGRGERFAAYMTHIAEALHHGPRTGPLTSYCTGLLSPCERKSVEVPDLIRDGGADGAQGHRGATSADAPFYRAGPVVRRWRPGARSRAHAAENRSARRHSGVDHR